MLADRDIQPAGLDQIQVERQSAERRHPAGCRLGFVLERQRTLCHASVTPLVMAPCFATTAYLLDSSRPMGNLIILDPHLRVPSCLSSDAVCLSQLSIATSHGCKLKAPASCERHRAAYGPSYSSGKADFPDGRRSCLLLRNDLVPASKAATRHGSDEMDVPPRFGHR